jgi:serine protease AprX
VGRLLTTALPKRKDELMPSSNLPPEEQREVKPFDPLVLDRTVIAVPLLEQMQEDLELIAEFEKRRPKVAQEFNSVIEFNKNFRGGAKAAREEVLKMVERAKDKALEASTKRVETSENEFKASTDQLRTTAEGRLADAKKRDAALHEAIEKQTIGPLQPKSAYSFALLHDAIIRRLLAANEHLASPKNPGAQPIERIYPKRFEIIIDLNLEYPGGREVARQWVFDHIERAKQEAKVHDAGQQIQFEKDRPNSQYVFARLEARAIQRLVALDMDAAKDLAEEIAAKKAPAEKEAAAKTDKDENATAKTAAETLKAATEIPPKTPDPSKCRAIFHIWPDFEVSAYINKSVATVKADAAQNSFSAWGTGITWAVMDSGIQQDHQHFQKYANIDPVSGWHKDFTVDGAGPFDDKNGHGTHVAGIIAGEWRVPVDAPKETRRPLAVSRYLKTGTGTEDIEYQQTRLDGICGMAPRCKLVSLRVLDENGKGAVSNLIAAMDHVQEINGQGRRLLIHGVNMSLGYNFEPEWFACGQSPLCVEVDRLVKTGVVVVVAAGNTGYGTLKSTIGATSAGMALTINDPGNSDLAITVGSTHRDMPHVYGVSYFSSKGPTGDGRLKPDLVAPGEKIISCATGNLKEEGAKNQECDYVETSGTSMAAPHVSGVIAAFLSVRTEFIGKAERVKEIFVSTATDLRRDRYFQGSGLVDLMRAIQSV